MPKARMSTDWHDINEKCHPVWVLGQHSYDVWWTFDGFLFVSLPELIEISFKSYTQLTGLVSADTLNLQEFLDSRTCHGFENFWVNENSCSVALQSSEFTKFSLFFLWLLQDIFLISTKNLVSLTETNLHCWLFGEFRNYYTDMSMLRHTDLSVLSVL